MEHVITMKRLSWVFLILFTACPVFAQDNDGGGGDDGGFFGGDGGGLFGGGGGGNAGGGNRGQAAPDRLMTLKDMLAKANVPLSRDQERALNTLLDKEIETMSAAFKAKFGQEPSAVVPQRGQFQGRGRAGAAGPDGAARG